MSEFHSSRDIKATRKAHYCEQCGRTIEASSPARYSSGKYEGEIYASYSHIECHQAAREFAKLNDLYGEEWPWFQHMEDSEFEHHAWLRGHHPVVADRLRIPSLKLVEA